MIKKLIISLLCICYSMIIMAGPAADLQYYQDKYPEQKIVEISSKQTVKINIVNGKPEIYLDEYKESILLADPITSSGKEDIFYSPVDSLLSIEAYTLVPDGNKYKKVPVKNFSHSSDMSDYVFFDDSKVCSFNYPSMAKGCKMVYQVKRKITNPYFLSAFFFSLGTTVDKSEVQFIYDSNIEMAFDLFGITDINKVQSNTKRSGNSITVVYRMENIPAIESEKNIRSILNYVPHIIPRISKYKPDKNAAEVEVLSSLDGLYKLYRNYINTIDKTEEPQLKILVDSITKNSKTELDKVKAVYYWVQHNIRYVAIEDGDKGMVPEGAASVFNTRFGDCKGMTNVMKVMLDNIGIKSYYTWVGTDRLPYKYTEIPSPIVDNHMILCYFDENAKVYLLDATGEFQNIEQPAGHIQGKECMVGIDDTHYEIIDIPFFPNNITESMVINIVGTGLKIKDTICYVGEYQNLIAYYMVHKSEFEKQRFYQNMLDKEGYPKSKVTSLQHSDLYDVEKPLCLYTTYDLSDYIMEIGDELYFKIYLGKLVESIIDTTKRKFPYELAQKSEWACKQVWNIPDQYAISHLPENISFNHPLFSLNIAITESKKNKQLIIDIDYKEDFILLPPEEYGKWNEMNKLIQQMKRQTIILKKNNYKK